MAPAGREVLKKALADGGITRNVNEILVLESVLIVFVCMSAVALHAAAYYGLKRIRVWGWITAVIVSAGWSVMLLGIPVLVFLLRRSTREAYGIS